MQIKLTRDQTRGVQLHFFPYLVAVCEMKVEHNAGNEDLLNNKMLICLLHEIKRIFERKLLSLPNKFTFKFSDDQGIVFYKLLMNIPLPADRFWLVNLRDHICDTLHKQMCEPITTEN